MVVGAKYVDRAVEAPLELVGEIDDICGAVGRSATLGRRANQHAVGVVTVFRRASPDGAVLLVGVEPRQELSETALEPALQGPGVEVDAEAVERTLDLLQHARNGILVG